MAAIERANAELERRGVSMSMVFGARHREHFPDGLPWTCTLRYARRRMTIAYYTQPGLEQEPTVAEVLASLSATLENTRMHKISSNSASPLATRGTVGDRNGPMRHARTRPGACTTSWATTTP